MRRFQTRAWVHTRANSGSAGQLRPDWDISHPENSKRAPEPANTHTLCCAIVISTGKLLVNAATVAPSPSVTNIMGRAQQTSVPLAANSVSQLRPVCFRIILFSVIANFLCAKLYRGTKHTTWSQLQVKPFRHTFVCLSVNRHVHLTRFRRRFVV
jgi:hypothetical protein